MPALLDDMYFDKTGTYTVTFGPGAEQSALIGVSAGAVTFNLNTAHSTGELLVGALSGAPTLTQAYGTLDAGYLSLGVPGSLSRLTLTGSLGSSSALLRTRSMGNRNYNGSGGDVIGDGGIAYLDVFGGAQYVCGDQGGASWPVQVAKDPADIAFVSVAGRDPLTLSYSAWRVQGTGSGLPSIIGVGGTASVYLYNGGYLDVTGDLMLAQLGGSSAYVTVGPSATFGTSRLNVRNHLWIGFNFYDSVVAGHAELAVKGRSWVHVAGRCDVGDPDNDAGSFLRVSEGSTFRVNGGIKFWPTAGMPLDLRGGLTHVNGGAFLWPAGKALVVSSLVGTPELAISSGVGSTGPSTVPSSSQLLVGRSGRGTLRLTQPGTVFLTGAGATMVGDSLGGVGTVIVDSLATLSSSGALNLGVRGQGVLSVANGSLVDVGTMAAGLASGGDGQALVHGEGSMLRVRDHLWLGGGFAGAGGLGTVSVEAGGVIDVLHTGGANPALTTIYAAGGKMSLTSGGSLVTTGTVSNAGQIVLADGQIEALNVSMPTTGLLTGSGHLNTMLQSNGSVSPGSAVAPIGRLDVDVSYLEFGQGRMIVDLGYDGNGSPVCDLLAVGGPVTLAGALELRTDPLSPPQPGEVFTILTGASVSGTFSTISWNGNSPLAGEALVFYQPGAVKVAIAGAPSAVDPGPGAESNLELKFARSVRAGGDLGFMLSLPGTANVQVKVYDIRGRMVAILQDGELAAGQHLLGATTGHRQVASGVYLARALVTRDRRTEVLTARVVVVH